METAADVVVVAAGGTVQAVAGQPLGNFGQLACQLANCLGNQHHGTGVLAATSIPVI